jgi:hypothetical protein
MLQTAIKNVQYFNKLQQVLEVSPGVVAQSGKFIVCSVACQKLLPK